MHRALIIKIGKDKYKIIPSGKYFVNTATPVGDPADFYELKPNGGKKLIEPLAFIRERKVEHYKYLVYDYARKDWTVSKNAPKSFLDFCSKVENNVFV